MDYQRLQFVCKPRGSTRRECPITILQERHFCVLQSDQSLGRGKTTVALSSVIHSHYSFSSMYSLKKVFVMILFGMMNIQEKCIKKEKM